MVSCPNLVSLLNLHNRLCWKETRGDLFKPFVTWCVATPLLTSSARCVRALTPVDCAWLLRLLIRARDPGVGQVEGGIIETLFSFEKQNFAMGVSVCVCVGGGKPEISGNGTWITKRGGFTGQDPCPYLSSPPLPAALLWIGLYSPV